MQGRALLLTLLFAACAGTPPPDEPMTTSPVGTSWKLTQIHGEPVLPNAEATLTFEDDRIVGSGGVNRYFGGWSVDGGSLRVSRIGATRMAGPPDAQQQEDRFLAALEAADGLVLEGSALALTQGGESVLAFERIP